MVLMEKCPAFLLGGVELEDSTTWRALLSWFWEAYKLTDDEHPIYHDGVVDDFSLAIPYYTHGDEGRGPRNTAFMVQSFQTVLSVKGPHETNNSGSLGFDFIPTSKGGNHHYITDGPSIFTIFAINSRYTYDT